MFKSKNPYFTITQFILLFLSLFFLKNSIIELILSLVLFSTTFSQKYKKLAQITLVTALFNTFCGKLGCGFVFGPIFDMPWVNPAILRTTWHFFTKTCVENVLTRTGSYIAWKWLSVKTMWQRSPGGDGTSGGMAAHGLVNGWQATAWRDERSEPPEVPPPPGRVQGRHKHHHDYLRSKLSGRGHVPLNYNFVLWF